MKPRPRVVDAVLDAMRVHRTFCVVGHVRPDGDCIGCQLALAGAIEKQGKKVVVWNEDPLPEKLAFLDPQRLLQPPRTGASFDCVVAVDAASYERLGRVGDCIRNRKCLVNIDHHPSNTRFGEVNWIDARAPATGELIYRLFQFAAWPVTPRIADCLFTAISTDTGSFQYPSTRPSSFTVAGELVKRGANLAGICRQVYQSCPLSRVRLLRHVFNRFRLTHQDQIAYVWLKPVDFVRTGASPAEAEGLIDHLRAIEPVVVACVFEELEPDFVRVSLRSKDPRVDVNRIASVFGGGGHAAAAGARIRGPRLSIQRRLLAAIQESIHQPASLNHAPGNRLLRRRHPDR